MNSRGVTLVEAVPENVPLCCDFTRVKLYSYRDDLRGNKNFFELAGGSSYQG